MGAGVGNWAGGQYSRANGGLGSWATGDYSTVGGGSQNAATESYATVAGGQLNFADNFYATISGGGHNHARGEFSVVAGGGGDAHADSNSAQGNLSVIGGGYHNYATGDASTIAGGYYHTASGGSATIGGGYRNTSTNSYSTVGGGTYNNATGQYATIAGGRNNGARGSHSFIGGGGGGISDSNSASGSYSAIAGGSGNLVSGPYSVLCGGRNNSVNDDYSFIGGGGGQHADSGNFINAYASVIGGGVANWMDSDSLPTLYGVIGGGHRNLVGDTSATVPGGEGNSAFASYSFAAGRHAAVWHRGSFVWSDASGSTTAADTTNQFVVGASGGVKFYTNSTRTAGLRLAAGGTSWIVISDSTKKTNRSRVDGENVLNKLAAMPIDQWNYKHQPDGPLHIGPMAQDFWNAFHLGTDSLGIETLDADGVLFAALKAVIERNDMLEKRVKQLESAVLQYGLHETNLNK
ncbi:MAG: tail fiber domain-containing protein [bacterium]|nr:tail fiber domain-containing protein [bacterium]